MQGPIERRCGLPIAILITGTMFCPGSPGLCPDPVALLSSRRRDLRRRDQSDQFDISSDCSAYSRQLVFEPRSLVARKGRMAGIRNFVACLGLGHIDHACRPDHNRTRNVPSVLKTLRIDRANDRWSESAFIDAP